MTFRFSYKEKKEHNKRIIKTCCSKSASYLEDTTTPWKAIKRRLSKAVVTGASNRVCTAKYKAFHLFLIGFLMEQCKSWTNIFFSIIVILESFPDLYPHGAWFTLAPLLFVNILSGFKECIEDRQRHKADENTNKSHVDVFMNDAWEQCYWSSLAEGNLIRVCKDSIIPADIVILSSSEPDGVCHIETVNLDGETNLKIRQALEKTRYISDNKENLKDFYCEIECDNPNEDLNRFSGICRLGDQIANISQYNFLERGTQIRNADWVVGVAVYIGHETKLLMNSRQALTKTSKTSQTTNGQVFFVIILITCLTIFATITFLLLKYGWSWPWYSSNFIFLIFRKAARYFIYIHNLIPISLNVALETVLFFQAKQIEYDSEMLYENTGTSASAKSSCLTDELGQVKYVLTDKTGTLTQNIMEFKHCAIAQHTFSVEELRGAIGSPTPDGNLNRNLQEFLTAMSICHTIIVDTNNGNLEYNGSSPDERALVEGAAKCGYTLKQRTLNGITVERQGESLTYELLHTFEFNSDRKRMSVVVKTPEGKVKIYCKGADNVIFDRLNDRNEQLIEVTMENLRQFAQQGLRTLCFAIGDITDDAYEQFIVEFKAANRSIENKEENIAKSIDRLESHLSRLLGASAIEDKLQDEVPQSIETLLQAGISVWILTGDKRETAINIGYSTKLFTQDMSLIMLENAPDMLNEIKTHIEVLKNRTLKSALVVEGSVLTNVLKKKLQADFFELCKSCASVVCCRVSPSQKAEIVDLVGRGTKQVTLAIGDGANDVAMIKRANIGVGMFGQEGMSAVNSSDFSIAQFRFLIPLLLKHGARNYARNSKMICFYFYKNALLCLTQVLFGWHSRFSALYLFEPYGVVLFNILFTTPPTLVVGLADTPFSKENALKRPELYTKNYAKNHFTKWKFWQPFLIACLHAIIIYCLVMFLFDTSNSPWMKSRSGGFYINGWIIFLSVLLTICLRGLIVVDEWNLYTLVAPTISFMSAIVFLVIFSYLAPAVTTVSTIRMAGAAEIIFTSPYSYIALMTLPALCLSVDFLNSLVRELWSIKTGGTAPETETESFDEKTDNLDQQRELGYVFSQHENHPVSESEIIRNRYLRDYNNQ